jgi:hypothetical protein
MNKAIMRSVLVFLMSLSPLLAIAQTYEVKVEHNVACRNARWRNPARRHLSPEGRRPISGSFATHSLMTSAMSPTLATGQRRGGFVAISAGRARAI